MGQSCLILTYLILTKPMHMDNDPTRMRRYACERIKHYRRVNKYSQADMAEKLWMSKRAYLRLENGETSMTLEKLHRISRVFDVPVGDLLGIENKSNSETLLKEFATLNERFKSNEVRILELLNELKKRLS